MKKFLLIVPVLIAAGLPQFAAAKPAGVSMAQARTIALKVAPGRIEKAEREREGGSLRYSFDIRQGNKIHEIGVDVATGRIVENKFEALNARD
ncbi:PepSY domain-containing protein [Sphingobium sp.]|uniref:PepSY domain-containing protein n=1 Tax=Sphingobium sp. TaxID=1912891 RepID=UPI0028BD8769|nr:PepSY domain-containing protein [Sphingobium sp.]